VIGGGTFGGGDGGDLDGDPRGDPRGGTGLTKIFKKVLFFKKKISEEKFSKILINYKRK
jgi:hypothetical protein